MLLMPLPVIDDADKIRLRPLPPLPRQDMRLMAPMPPFSLSLDA